MKVHIIITIEIKQAYTIYWHNISMLPWQPVFNVISERLGCHGNTDKAPFTICHHNIGNGH